MSIYADEGTAAHWVLEQCLASIHTLGLLARAEDYTGFKFFMGNGEESKHSQLAPSSADRWMQCPGSVQMARACQDAQDAQDDGPRHIVFTEDYAIAVQEVLDYVAARALELTEKTGHPTIVYTERQVSPYRYLKTHDCDGTLDITLVSDFEIEVIDAKFGAGVPVLPTSRQPRLYLLGVQAEYDALFKNARITIAQPRCAKVFPKIRSEDIHVRDWIENFTAECLAAIAATKQEPPILKPSEEACRFCPARGCCSVATRHALTQATVLDGHIPVSAEDLYATLEKFANLDPFRLTPGQMRAIIDGADFLVATLSAVKNRVTGILKQSDAPKELAEAYKLVRASTHRRWAHDTEEIEKRLKKIRILDPKGQKTRALGRKDLVATTLKSPAQIETMLTQHFDVSRKDARFDAFQALITKPEGALVLVSIADPRPSVGSDQDPQRALGTGPDIPPTN